MFHPQSLHLPPHSLANTSGQIDCWVGGWRNRWTGLWLAGLLIWLWFLSLGVLLVQPVEGVGWWLWAIPLMGLRTFLHTGLFIMAHDAMHGSLFPHRPRWNRPVGRLALVLYALLPYDSQRRNHLLHHRKPAREGDPDFPVGAKGMFWGWYGQFMSRYLRGRQGWGIGVGFGLIFVGLLGAGISVVNLVLFWLVPLVLSSVQLFYFGIYLPHRPIGEGYDNRHHARSLEYGPLRSLLACYHLGYHWEHHEYPQVPWYQLPAQRRARLAAALPVCISAVNRPPSAAQSPNDCKKRPGPGHREPGLSG